MTISNFDWAIIGAGPAGIAAIGKLLDSGVAPGAIAWLDPEFRVGDFGARWRNVTSNTRVELFLKFLNRYQAFDYANAPNFAIDHADPQSTCLLSVIIDPLQWVSDHLKLSVQAINTTVQHLHHINGGWEWTLSDKVLFSKKVILALGAEPTSLALPQTGVFEIPLTTALDPYKLAMACEFNDTVGVFGSSHSAILIIKSLVEMPTIKQVINFYRQPLKYAVYYPDYILFDDTGLKGVAADWAKKNIESELHPKLIRTISTSSAVAEYLPKCDRVIYATGFSQRQIAVDGLDSLTYNDKTGVIAAGLFGLGIAFPEARVDRFGNLEYRVGLWKFVDYLDRVMQDWLNE